jgi:glycosyltransferase involved in cell wall biosynthesis
MNIKPVISILILAFNKGKYIEKLLHSIISQQTDYGYLIYIGLDGSSDCSVEIIKKYQRAYPGIIKYFMNPKKNLKRKIADEDLHNFIDLYKRVNTKFFTIVDGDDFYISKNKLNNQINFLLDNNSYIGCCHNFKLYFDESHKYSINPNSKTPEDIKNINSYLLSNKVSYCHTATFVFRNEPTVKSFILKNFNNGYFKGDFIRSLTFLHFGPIKYFPKLYSAYRINKTGAWSQQSQIDNLKYNIKLINFHKNNKTFGKYYKKTFLIYNLYSISNLLDFRINFIDKIFYTLQIKYINFYLSKLG